MTVMNQYSLSTCSSIDKFYHVHGDSTILAIKKDESKEMPYQVLHITLIHGGTMYLYLHSWQVSTRCTNVPSHHGASACYCLSHFAWTGHEPACENGMLGQSDAILLCLALDSDAMCLTWIWYLWSSTTWSICNMCLSDSSVTSWSLIILFAQSLWPIDPPEES